eukprot:scaffold13285_cov63-Phaeocystis_antarctica.AAC.1
MCFDMRDKVMNVPRAYRGTSKDGDTINTENLGFVKLRVLADTASFKPGVPAFHFQGLPAGRKPPSDPSFPGKEAASPFRLPCP